LKLPLSDLQHLEGLELPEGLRAQLERLAEAAYPREVCGLFVGRRTGKLMRVLSVHETSNLAAESDRFDIDPGELVQIDNAARASGLQVCGVWHSHPIQDATPSKLDLEGAWSAIPQVIVALDRGKSADVRAWWIDAGRGFFELQIVS